MAKSASAAALAEVKRQHILAGIEDTEGTIHANDAKCSAALITHGLLFAALVTVSGSAAKLYPHTPNGLRIVAVGFGAAALLAFACSIILLLRAVRPFRPMDFVDEISSGRKRPPGVFFPEPRTKPAKAVTSYRAAVDKLNDEAVIDDLVGEAIKLGAIRIHESKYAKRGYNALIVEVVLVVIYLLLVGAAALTVS